MKVLVIGANGLTGRLLTQILADGPHHPVAMIRDPEQAPTFEDMGVPVRVADLEDPLDSVLEEIDAVCFVAGAGSSAPEKATAVDRDGAIRLIAAMEATGVDRLVLLSSRGANPDSEGHPLSSYLRAKGIADEHIRRSDLHWTIVRPGRLTNDEGTGEITARTESMTEGHTTRQTLAQVLAACLDEETTQGVTIDMKEGGQPVRQALREMERP